MVYKVLTIEQANNIQKNFSITKPKDWNIYIEGHGILIYSPLGTEIRKKYRSTEIKDTVTRNNEAKNIFEHNKNNIDKKGSYNENFLRITSGYIDSIKINTFDDLINWYLRNQRKRFNNNFNYKIIREKNDRFGEIIYYKYGTDDFFKRTYFDALILVDNRFYTFSYTSFNRFYDYYIHDVLNMIKSLKIKE